MSESKSIFMDGHKIAGDEVYIIDRVIELDPATGRATLDGRLTVALVDRGEVTFHESAMAAQKAYRRKHRIEDE